MKRYFLIILIVTSLLLSACGSTENDVAMDDGSNSILVSEETVEVKKLDQKQYSIYGLKFELSEEWDCIESESDHLSFENEQVGMLKVLLSYDSTTAVDEPLYIEQVKAVFEQGGYSSPSAAIVSINNLTCLSVNSDMGLVKSSLIAFNFKDAVVSFLLTTNSSYDEKNVLYDIINSVDIAEGGNTAEAKDSVLLKYTIDDLEFELLNEWTQIKDDDGLLFKNGEVMLSVSILESDYKADDSRYAAVLTDKIKSEGYDVFYNKVEYLNAIPCLRIDSGIIENIYYSHVLCFNYNDKIVQAILFDFSPRPESDALEDFISTIDFN